MTNIGYDECNHQFKFHIGADKSGYHGAKPWTSFFICEKCSTVINFLEKCALEKIVSLKKSLKIQEKHTRNGMWANIIAAIMMLIALITLLFGDNVIEFLTRNS